jgi:hypothetical protein
MKIIFGPPDNGFVREEVIHKMGKGTGAGKLLWKFARRGQNAADLRYCRNRQ